MKNTTRFILGPGPVCAIVLAAACVAQADLRDSVTGEAGVGSLARTTRIASDIATQSRRLGSSTGLFAEGFSDAEQSPFTAEASHDVAKSTLVRQMPAAPDSASLFLSAVLSVGAWHLVRSARQYTGNLPEWYHSEGPQQIGAAVRFVPNERVPALFIPIAIAIAAMPVTRIRARQRPLRNTRMAFAIAVPRGPPPRVLKSCW